MADQSYQLTVQSYGFCGKTEEMFTVWKKNHVNQPWMDQPLADTTHHQDEEWHYLWWTTTMFRVMSYLQLVIYKLKLTRKYPQKGKENTELNQINLNL